jgi:N-acyl homoserine lactone hydrolase
VAVHAFHCGNDNAFAAVYDPLDDDPGRRTPGPFFFYLVEHPDGNVLFDSGAPLRLVGDSKLAEDFGVTMSADDYVVQRLAAAGIQATDVDHVVASHLHFDHAGGLNEFAHAQVYVHPRELGFARQPPVYQREIYDVADFSRIETWREVEDGADLFGDARLKILHTPGHTPGHIALAVQADTSFFVLAADAAYRSSKMRERKLPGILWSPDEMIASWERLEGLERERGAKLVFSHDTDYAENPIRGVEYHL